MSRKFAVGHFPDVVPSAGTNPMQHNMVSVYNGTGSTLTANEAVKIDVSDTTHGLGRSVTPITAAAALGAEAGVFAGVVAEDIPNGEFGLIYGRGSVCLVEGDAGITAGAKLTTGTTTDGHLGAATAAEETAVAGALEALSATVTGQVTVVLQAGLFA